MHIANKRRFAAFLAVVIVAMLIGAGAWYFFQPVPLIEQLARTINIEQMGKIELTEVIGDGESQSVVLTDPTDIRACLSVLTGARVRRQLFKDTVRVISPGKSFLLRLTDAQAREAVLDVAERSIILNLNTGFYLVEPDDLSALESVRASIADAA